MIKKTWEQLTRDNIYYGAKVRRIGTKKTGYVYGMTRAMFPPFKFSCKCGLSGDVDEFEIEIEREYVYKIRQISTGKFVAPGNAAKKQWTTEAHAVNAIVNSSKNPSLYNLVELQLVEINSEGMVHKVEDKKEKERIKKQKEAERLMNIRLQSQATQDSYEEQLKALKKKFNK